MNQKLDPNYKPFPAKDPSIDNPLPQYFGRGRPTPDQYDLLFRDNLHPDCPNYNGDTIGAVSMIVLDVFMKMKVSDGVHLKKSVRRFAQGLKSNLGRWDIRRLMSVSRRSARSSRRHKQSWKRNRKN